MLILEREARQGLGSTGKSIGGVRAQFATETNIRLSMYSIPFLAQFEEITGHPSDYKPQGYLLLATSPAEMNYLRANYNLQVSLGLKTAELISREDVVKILPQIHADDIVGGAYCSTDGFVDPHSVMSGFTARAIDAGATLCRSVEVTGINVEGGAISGVETTKGRIDTSTVVNAAGPWAAGVAAMAGVQLPVEPLPRMELRTESFQGMPDRLPMIFDLTKGLHFRPEGLALLMGWADPNEKPGFKTEFDVTSIEKTLTVAAERVPCFADLAVDPRKCWAGMYEMSPDHHAILGPSPDVKGLYFANGFSGHGVMHSPATGRILADLILHGESRIIDQGALSVRRFDEGREIQETAIV